MKRIFIAIRIEAQERLIEMISSLKRGLKEENIRWTDLDNLHITLAFIGDMDENKIGSVSSMLTEKCSGSAPFNLVLRGAGLFRNMNDPRVIWTGIEPSGMLIHLNSSIMDGLNDIHINIEKRPFTPHLTLGRVKNIKNREMLKSLIAGYENAEIQKMEVSAVILYESILKQSGAIYKIITRSSLV